MQSGYAPIQYKDISSTAARSGGVTFRISYGVQHGGAADPHFVCKVETIDGSRAEDDAGLYLSDTGDAETVVAALFSVI